MALEKATIVNTDTDERIQVLFNPEEYTLATSNEFAEIGIPGRSSPPIQYVKGGTRTLKMELFFDTYEKRSDVRAFTMQITGLLDKTTTTKAPPVLLFTWGRLNLQCVLESASQRFTMFLSDGTPVRATLTVSFKEFQPVSFTVKHGLFIGPPTVQNIVKGQTLSGLAGSAMGDASAWREIAQLNDIDNPRKVPSGKKLIVPSQQQSKKTT